MNVITHGSVGVGSDQVGLVRVVWFGWVSGWVVDGRGSLRLCKLVDCTCTTFHAEE